MLNLALWLKHHDFRLDQVQTFTPTPMAMATAMYHSGKNPLRKVTQDSEDVPIPKAGGVRRLHKAFIRYHDPKNWPLLREALKRMGRADLIGNAKKCLIRAWQPLGTTEDAPRGHQTRPTSSRPAFPDKKHASKKLEAKKPFRRSR